MVGRVVEGELEEIKDGGRMGEAPRARDKSSEPLSRKRRSHDDCRMAITPRYGVGSFQQGSSGVLGGYRAAHGGTGSRQPITAPNVPGNCGGVTTGWTVAGA